MLSNEACAVPLTTILAAKIGKRFVLNWKRRLIRAY